MKKKEELYKYSSKEIAKKLGIQIHIFHNIKRMLKIHGVMKQVDGEPNQEFFKESQIRKIQEYVNKNRKRYGLLKEVGISTLIPKELPKKDKIVAQYSNTSVTSARNVEYIYNKLISIEYDLQSIKAKNYDMNKKLKILIGFGVVILLGTMILIVKGV